MKVINDENKRLQHYSEMTFNTKLILKTYTNIQINPKIFTFYFWVI